MKMFIATALLLFVCGCSEMEIKDNLEDWGKKIDAAAMKVDKNADKLKAKVTPEQVAKLKAQLDAGGAQALEAIAQYKILEQMLKDAGL